MKAMYIVLPFSRGFFINLCRHKILITDLYTPQLASSPGSPSRAQSDG